jgi:hypothetical protein
VKKKIRKKVQGTKIAPMNDEQILAQRKGEK